MTKEYTAMNRIKPIWILLAIFVVFLAGCYE